MNRLFLLGLLLYGLFFLGLITLSGVPLALMIPLLVYVFAGHYFSPRELSVKISRNLTASRVLQDTPVEVILEVTNEGARQEEITISDLAAEELGAMDGTGRLMTLLESGETVSFSYKLRQKRGHYRLQDLQINSCDHSGIFCRRKSLSLENRLTVLPNALKLKRVAIQPRRTKVYSGLIASRTGGQGVEFFGVREHQPGDPPRLINWKATARNPQRLFTNEFEQERVSDVGLILDARQISYQGTQGEALFEYAVSAAAALSEVFLGDGNRVGFYIYGRVVDWTFPGYGKRQEERILQALAMAKTGIHSLFEKLEHLPTRLFPAGSQLVFVSPLLRDDLNTLCQLRARGYQVIVVSPDPISLEKESLRPDPDLELASRIARLHRRLLLRKLMQEGIQVVDWPVDRPFIDIVAIAMTRQPFQHRYMKVLQ